MLLIAAPSDIQIEDGIGYETLADQKQNNGKLNILKLCSPPTRTAKREGDPFEQKKKKKKKLDSENCMKHVKSTFFIPVRCRI